MTRGKSEGQANRPLPAGAEIVPLRGAAVTAADTLLRAFFVLANAFPEEADSALPIEWCGRAHEETATISRLVEALAAQLVWRVTGQRPGHGPSDGSGRRVPLWLRRALGRSDPPSDEDLEALAQAIEVEAVTLAGELGARVPAEVLPSTRHQANGLTGELIREQGLEAGLDLYLVHLDEDGGPGIAWTPMPAHRAVVWSMGRLFDRIEAMLGSDWMLTAERHAVHWYFSRWSGTGNGAKEFTRGVREQEYALVDRPLIATGSTPLDALIDDERFDELPRRQRQLAEALDGSIVSVFTVRDRRGHEVVFEAGGSHRTYDVLEHSRETEYEAGFIGIGRLIPVEGHYLRSPGMVLLDMDDPSVADYLTRGIIDADGTAPLAILMEGVITALVDRVEVPRRVPPAPSRHVARQMFEDFTEALDELGLGAGVTDEGLLKELKGREAGGFRQYRLDQALMEWLTALGEQSQGAKPSAGGTRKPRHETGAPSTTVVREAPKPPGRNDPCTCGSGKKFKRCCGR